MIYFPDLYVSINSFNLSKTIEQILIVIVSEPSQIETFALTTMTYTVLRVMILNKVRF